jgi:hypothetical protein
VTAETNLELFDTAEIAEAKGLLKSQPLASDLSRSSVSLAAFDPVTLQINLFSAPKDSFLTKGVDLRATTHLGRSMLMHVVRANGVNTAVMISDAATGGSFLPLAVAYPIAKKGAVTETAYYTSAHPALLSPKLVSVW